MMSISRALAHLALHSRAVLVAPLALGSLAGCSFSQTETNGVQVRLEVPATTDNEILLSQDTASNARGAPTVASATELNCHALNVTASDIPVSTSCSSAIESPMRCYARAAPRLAIPGPACSMSVHEPTEARSVYPRVLEHS